MPPRPPFLPRALLRPPLKRAKGSKDPKEARDPRALKTLKSRALYPLGVLGSSYNYRHPGPPPGVGVRVGDIEPGRGGLMKIAIVIF